MGTDIHWILERRGGHGAWHTVGAKDRYYAARDQGFEANDQVPEYRIGRRHYDVFGLLSGVRGRSLPKGPLMNEGPPDDASEGARVAIESFGYGHDWGWADGAMILGWRRRRRSRILDPWLNGLQAFMSAGPIDEVIPPMRKVDGQWHYPDIVGVETGHEALARAEAGQDLIDWRADPASWRLIVYYDS